MNRAAASFLATIIFLLLVVMAGFVYSLNSRVEELTEQVDSLETQLVTIQENAGNRAPSASPRRKRESPPPQKQTPAPKPKPESGQK